MKQSILFYFLLFAFTCQAQYAQKFNLDFEVHSKPSGLPDGWHQWGEFELSVDSMAQSGKKSAKINSGSSDSEFGSIAYKIPAQYEGKSIRLEGYMKIRDVKDGFAGLLLRIDGNGGTLAFDNMQAQQITGTADWKKYSVRLKYPEDAQNIFVGGILVGKGEVWFDKFKVFIDGMDVQLLKIAEQKIYDADLDKEFDKGSRISFGVLTPAVIDNLELLGRVWGFLKYQHPAVGEGKYNWDYELFRFLPKYIEVENNSRRNKLLISWINSFGKIEKCTSCKPTKENAFLKPDHAWISQQAKPLQKKLMYIYENRHQGKHYYIGMQHNINNPTFLHENAYPEMPYPDDGFRLLTVYKYWNMINYFFPYRHLMDEDWNLVLKQFIPEFIQAKNELEYEFVATQLIGKVQDSHANLRGGGDQIEKWKGGFFAPVHIRFIEDQLVVTDYYNPELKEVTGLSIGDIVTKVNGESIDQWIEANSKYYPASNRPSMLRNLSRDILRSTTDEIKISYIDKSDQEKESNLKLYPKDSLNMYFWYPQDKNKCYKLLDDNIGYITLKSIKATDISKIKNEFKETKGIIIDIRNYPSNFVPFSLGSFFVATSTPFVKFTKGSVDNPGEFTFTQKLEIPNRGETYKGKLIVLVNELSQSQAEYTTMAFEAGVNTTVVGSTTAGADGNVSYIFLPGGLKTRISGIGVYYPEGKETQRIGIVPDVEVHPTIQGVRNGRDEVLEKAISIILED